MKQMTEEKKICNQFFTINFLCDQFSVFPEAYKIIYEDFMCFFQLLPHFPHSSLYKI